MATWLWQPGRFSLNLNQKNQSGNEIFSIFHLPLLDEALFLLFVHSLSPLFPGWFGLCKAGRPPLSPDLSDTFPGTALRELLSSHQPFSSHSSAGDWVCRRSLGSPAALSEALAPLHIFLVLLISYCFCASASLSGQNNTHCISCEWLI